LQTLLSLIVILTLIFMLGAVKVLLRTNPIIAIAALGGGGLILAACWLIYQKYYSA
jgi:NADH:ubiquinone oxidoreductase subunit 6 (subunit J)